MANYKRVVQLGLRAKRNLSDEEQAAEKRFSDLKLQLADRIRHDARLTQATRIVGAELASLSNFRSGHAWGSQDYLAEKLGVNLSTVKRALKQLENANYFCIHVIRKRSEPGETKLLYYPIFKALAENDTGQNALCEKSHKGQKRIPHSAKSASDKGQNVPPISLEISLGISAPAGTGSAVGAPDGAAGQAGFDLGLPGAALRRRLGDDVFRSWFAEVAVVEIAGDQLVLSAPTLFKANYIAANFENPIMACWSSWRPQHPAIRRLRITVAVTPHPSTPPERADTDASWLLRDGRDIIATLMPTTSEAADKIMVNWLRRCGGDHSSLRRILQEAETQRLANDQFRDFVKRQTKALLRADHPALPLSLVVMASPQEERIDNSRDVSA